MRSRVLKGFFLALIVFLLYPICVLAIGNPDYTSIGEGIAFRNVLTEGDQLYFCRYDASYSSTPSEYASDTWQIALYDSSSNLVATRPLNYYQHNIISIYLEPDEAITWEDSNTIRVMGMPSIFGTLIEGTNMATKVLAPGDYKESTDLSAAIIAQAEILESDWGITLLTSGDKLNTTGATYFTAAIPGLGSMEPSLFQTTVSSPSSTALTGNSTYIDSLPANSGEKLDEALDDFGGYMGVSGNWMAYWGLGVIFLVLVSIMFAGSGNPGWALAGGVVIIAGGAFMGIGDETFQLWSSIALGVIVLFAILFILGRFS